MTDRPSHPHPPGRPKDPALAQRRREEILHHATRHFARHGYSKADLEAIALDVGCAKGTLYRYFKNKDDLFHAAVDGVMAQLLRTTAASSSEDPVEQLQYAIRSFLAYFDAHPEYVELLIQERAQFRDRRKPTYFQYRDTHSNRWNERLRLLIVQGRFREMPVDRALDVIGDSLYGAIFMNYFAGRHKPLERQAADLLDVLFCGLYTPAEARRRGGCASGETGANR